MKRLKAQDAIRSLKAEANPGKGALLQQFFKTGKGEYAEGDKFLGLTVPQSRVIAKMYQDLPLVEVEKLLASPIHEARLIALIILVHQFSKGSESVKKEIFNFYISHTGRINNWDLVDVSAHIIVGGYLWGRDTRILYKLAKSQYLWDRRIAIVATYYFIKKGKFGDTLAIAEILMNDKHDLIHKAAGWMLREVGKKDVKMLEAFLDMHCLRLPRTTLRYAIEKFPLKKRMHYLKRV